MIQRAGILLVSGDADIFEQICSRLTALGYDAPALASSGAEAIGSVKARAFDLILMDFALPEGMDGAAACEALAPHTDAPVILLAPGDPGEDLARALASTACEILITPFHDAQLQAALRSALRHWRDRDASSGAHSRVMSDEESIAQKDEAQTVLRAFRDEEIASLSENLGVHRAELEQQNEELRQIRNHLETLRDKYLNLYDFAPVGYFTLDEKGLVTEINLSACEMLKTPRQRMLQSHFSRFVDQDCVDRYYLHLKNVLKSDEKQRCEIVLLTPGKAPIEVMLESVRAPRPNGEPVCRSAMLDMTNRKQAERALKASEEFNKAIIESSHDCIKVLDAEGRLVFMNPGGQSLLEIDTLDGYLGRPYLEFWEGSNIAEAKAAMEEAKKGNPGFFEGCCLTAKGDPKWWDVVVTPISGRTGDIERYLVISRDISARKKAEESNLLAREAAESSNRSKSEFLANMSHEIRTPLNGVLGMLQLLRTGALDQEQFEYVSIALKSGWNLLTILNDILNLSRIEAGKLPLVETRLEVGAFVDSIIQTFAQQALAKGLSLASSVDTNVPARITIDEGRLRQILFNLVGNSMKFTESGEIRVAVSALPESPGPGLVRLLFSVSDTGIGVPDDKIDYIFRSFAQIDGTLARKHGGSGLGLGIVRRLTELMGGTISVDSEEGKGTSVYFTVVAKRRDAVAEAGSRATKSEPAGPLHILLVEDDAINALTARRMLEKLGHKVKGVDNGKDAMLKLSEDDFDCILMDIQLPEMDGLETTRRIRTSSEFGEKKRIPIIAMTAHAMKEDREQFLAAGMDSYISKPIALNFLAEVLGDVRNASGKSHDRHA